MSTATLPELDSSLYPQVWEQQIYDNPQTLLIALLRGNLSLDPNAFTTQLLSNDGYQEWINASIFGRYLQCHFAAFYNQNEDSFNIDIPTLFRNELLRHAQYLPFQQVLFVAGNMPKNARHEKLFTTTVNPATVVMGAQKLKQDACQSMLINTQGPIVNQIQVKAKQVLGFPIRHNKRTSDRIRNEVLVLNFNDLRLVDEQSVEQSNIGRPILLRYYELR